MSALDPLPGGPGGDAGALAGAPGGPGLDDTDDAFEHDIADDVESADTDEEPPTAKEMAPEVLNDDLDPGGAGPGTVAPTSDPDPTDAEGRFPGRPLTDAELDALPVDDDDLV